MILSTAENIVEPNLGEKTKFEKCNSVKETSLTLNKPSYAPRILMTLNGGNSRRNGLLTAITLLLAWKLSRSRDYTPLEREKGSGQLFGVQKWFKYSRYG